MPEFELPDTDQTLRGSNYLRSGAAALVVFSCNHCPYVKGTDLMLIGIAQRFSETGLRIVAINSNDAVQYPEDSIENMKLKASELSLPFPYLRDETQAVARMFDAACTPECFLFNSSGSLVYQGAITNRPTEPDADRVDLLSPAIECCLKGVEPDPNFNHPIGCSIKWRTSNA
ncbi:MAG: thioredoxin family protein [Bdellovibrionales bacterium]|nr:thioredoxin family protein [Bdellovibrionales bacterium]